MRPAGSNDLITTNDIVSKGIMHARWNYYYSYCQHEILDQLVNLFPGCEWTKLVNPMEDKVG